METIHIKPLTAAAFAPFGDILSAEGDPSFLINNDKCGRYHDLARPEVTGTGGNVGFNVFRAEAYSLPHTLKMMERHPLGSQAFSPMTETEYLIVVAEDVNGRPERPQAFIANVGQGVNYHRNTWHEVLTPLNRTADFLVVDRVGSDDNLEEYFFDTPYLVDHKP